MKTRFIWPIVRGVFWLIEMVSYISIYCICGSSEEATGMVHLGSMFASSLQLKPMRSVDMAASEV
ncbi:uncharacterized protein BDW47DRAFT_101685 [Aspergillus candidus]|uniref:Uncharacterized protein n=1 Tax=Aspergillus candidus TaxID=41067 RepID=A0A2I2FI20_ASPCN|nr:hypothetical protein BDW47DRAFT_101685 [Aspergillus candidus]PLB40264.1 hypothetical protein BDW47DRAFT_101685 [Aspergillus candidus]